MASPNRKPRSSADTLTSDRGMTTPFRLASACMWRPYLRNQTSGPDRRLSPLSPHPQGARGAVSGRLHYRKLNGEHGPPADLALHVDGAAVGLDDLARRGQ